MSYCFNFIIICQSVNNVECLFIDMQDFKDSELERTLADPTTLATWKNQLLHVSISDFIKGKPFYQKEILNLDKRLQVVLYMDVNYVTSSCITVQWPLVSFRVYNCPSATRMTQSDHSLPHRWNLVGTGCLLTALQSQGPLFVFEQTEPSPVSRREVLLLPKVLLS